MTTVTIGRLTADGNKAMSPRTAIAIKAECGSQFGMRL
jgi:hypothetical protein